MTAALSPRQWAMVAFVRSYTAARGYAPSIAEIMTGTAASSKSVVAYNLRALRDMGVITYEDGKSRTVRVVE
jgi:SOS-response transcriptional repressor LexA